MDKHIRSFSKMEEIAPLISEILDVGGSIRLYPSGSSMLPMLREGKDSVILSPVTGRLKKFDIPLYRREDGKYILHRITDAGDTYTCMGDNQFVPETNIRQEQLCAVVTAYYRGKRLCQIHAPGYRLYCKFWDRTRSVRHYWRRGIRWIGRHFC